MLSIGLKLQHHCLDGLLPLPVASSRMPQARGKQSSSFVWSRIAAPLLSCSENLEVEASVTRYSNTLLHVRPVVPEHNGRVVTIPQVGGLHHRKASPDFIGLP